MLNAVGGGAAFRNHSVPIGVIAAAFAEAFALTASPTESDHVADMIPIRRIAFAVLRLDWHV